MRMNWQPPGPNTTGAYKLRVESISPHWKRKNSPRWERVPWAHYVSNKIDFSGSSSCVAFYRFCGNPTKLKRMPDAWKYFLAATGTVNDHYARVEKPINYALVHMNTLDLWQQHFEHPT